MTDCSTRHELGAYVLGSLDDADVQALEAHLDACLDCRVERDELARLPGLLDLAADTAPPIPARVRDRVVAEAARRRGRRRWTLAAAAAAVAAALLGGSIGWVLAPEAEPAMAVPLREPDVYEASGWAEFRVEGDLVVVELELGHLEPLEAPAVYEAWLSTHDDRVLSIGQLEPGPDGRVEDVLFADGPLADYRGFWVTAEPDRRDPAHEGPTVVAAPVPPVR